LVRLVAKSKSNPEHVALAAEVLIDELTILKEKFKIFVLLFFFLGFWADNEETKGDEDTY